MTAKFVAAIDHGTTSTRCILFDELGAPIAIAQRGQTMHYPRPGWVELDVDGVWNRTQECIHETLGSASAAPADIAGIGITNERESVVLWDRRTGRPVARSIVWQDTRTAAAADALAADGGIQRLQNRTGLPISTYSSALKWDGCSTRTGPRGRRPTGGTSCSAHRTPGFSGTSQAVRTAGCTQRIRRMQAAPS
jgi:glycerol kinase